MLAFRFMASLEWSSTWELTVVSNHWYQCHKPQAYLLIEFCSSSVHLFISLCPYWLVLLAKFIAWLLLTFSQKLQIVFHWDHKYPIFIWIRFCVPSTGMFQSLSWHYPYLCRPFPLVARVRLWAVPIINAFVTLIMSCSEFMPFTFSFVPSKTVLLIATYNSIILFSFYNCSILFYLSICFLL